MPGPRIVAIEAFAVAGPLSDLCFVKVTTSEPGLVGWGEASLPGRCPAVAAAVRDMAPLLVGMGALHTERCWQRMYRHSYWRGGPILTSSISGIDIALWDIRGRRLGVSVLDLVGGPVRDSVRLYANVGLSTDPEELADRTRAAVQAGYTAVKFYPLPAVQAVEGPAAAAAVAQCSERVREVLGPGGDFALDFHGRCSAAVAVRIEAAVRHTGPLWIEEPVPAEAPWLLEPCARAFVTPIAVGERLFTRWGFKDVLERGWAGVVQPDVANAGGVSELMKISAMAECHGVAFNPHNPNGPVQGAVSMTLAAAAPTFTVLEHRHDLEDRMGDLASPAPRGRNGFAVAPSGVGWGIEVDEAALMRRPATHYVTEAFRSDGSVADW